MKATLFLSFLAAVFLSALADDITFTNKTASFTNLQGQLFKGVQLVRGDLDGLIWRDGASGGRICYTNLHPDLLESFGISTNRIEIAGARAQHKAVADARYRALAFAEAQAQLHAQARLTNATPSLSSSDGSAVAYSPGVTYGPGSPYGPGVGYGMGFPYGSRFPYWPGLPYGPGVASAPSAPSAPSALLAPSAPPAPSAAPAFVPPPYYQKGPLKGQVQLRR